jgi:hypothetical protein
MCITSCCNAFSPRAFELFGFPFEDMENVINAVAMGVFI